MQADRKSTKYCIIRPIYVVGNILNLGNSCLSLDLPNYFLQIHKATVQPKDEHFCQLIQSPNDISGNFSSCKQMAKQAFLLSMLLIYLII